VQPTFSRIDTDSSGFISFDTWLSYIYPHICEKGSTLNQREAASRMEQSKEDFRNFIIQACRSRASMEYKELYSFSLRCFTEADTDGDGKIGAEAFNALIDIAAQALRRFSLAPPAMAMLKSRERKVATRKAMFERIWMKTRVVSSPSKNGSPYPTSIYAKRKRAFTLG